MASLYPINPIVVEWSVNCRPSQDATAGLQLLSVKQRQFPHLPPSVFSWALVIFVRCLSLVREINLNDLLNCALVVASQAPNSDYAYMLDHIALTDLYDSASEVEFKQLPLVVRRMHCHLSFVLTSVKLARNLPRNRSFHWYGRECVQYIPMHEVKIEESDEKLGAGAFGSVDKVTLVHKGDRWPAARKRFFIKDSNYSPLHTAVTVYRRLDGVLGVPQFFTCNNEAIFLQCGKANLHDVIFKGTVRYNIDQILLWTQQMLQTLELVHRAGVVHRDLKPDNVVLGPGNQTLIIDWSSSLVTDGSVRVDVEQPRPEASWTSLWYRAPEEWDGPDVGETYVPRALDIWSLGTLCTQLLLRERPFIGDDGKVCSWADLNGAHEQTLSQLEARLKGRDDLFLDLLSRMLALDFRARISAGEALDHATFERRLQPMCHFLPANPADESSNG